MPSDCAERLTALLETYRGQMREGGHPPELPDRILALVRDTPPREGAPPPRDLERLIAAAGHYWRLHVDAGDDEPDPLDLEMINDELIDALYDYYEA